MARDLFVPPMVSQFATRAAVIVRSALSPRSETWLALVVEYSCCWGRGEQHTTHPPSSHAEEAIHLGRESQHVGHCILNAVVIEPKRIPRRRSVRETV
jgi:hypothetical protein